MNKKLEHNRAVLVEELGHMLEHSRGIPRMAGKIFSLLMLTDKEQLSAEELANCLEASRGSVSTMIRMLTHMGFVKRVSVRGDRKRYYQVADPTVMFDVDLLLLRHSVAFLIGAKETLGKKDSVTQQRLKEHLEFYRFIEKESSLLLEQWQQQQKKKS